MTREIKVGEILRIEDKEFMIINTEHKNGRITWEQPTLVKLDTAIQNTSRKKHFRGSEAPLKSCSIKKKDIKKLGLIKLKIN